MHNDLITQVFIYFSFVLNVKLRFVSDRIIFVRVVHSFIGVLVSKLIMSTWDS